MEELTSQEKRQIADEESVRKVKEAVSTIIKEINVMGNEEMVGQAVVEELGRTHRTLQQNFFRDVVVPLINHYAEMNEKGWYDLRNEDTCKCAAQLKPVLDEFGFRFI